MSKISCLFFSVLLLGGCMINGSEETAKERFTFEVTGEPKVAVRLDDGSIEVVGTSTNEIAVTVIKKARGPSSEAAAALLEQIHVDVDQQDGVVRVETREGAGRDWEHEGISIRTGSLRADVEIRVPRKVDLELVTTDGRIEIENVEGRIEAESEDGRVQLRDVEGKVQILTSDGSVVGSGLNGTFEIVSGDGRIELDGRFTGLKAETSDGSVKVRCNDGTPSPTEDWVLRTSDGSVGLTLPQGISAELEASTNDGRIENDLALSASEENKRFVKGRLGNGGKLILIRTSDGNIRLRIR